MGTRGRIAAAIVALALAATACGDDGGTASDESTTTTAPTTTSTTSDSTTTTTEAPTTTAAPTTTEAQMSGVVLPAYPIWATEVILPDQDRLDSLAADYLATSGDTSMERFLFGQMPVVVFDDLFANGAAADTAELFWLLHLSGYFGGRWLRAEIAEAQPDAPLVGFSNPPTEVGFSSTMDRAAARIAVTDDQAAVVAAARDALFDKPPPAEGEDPVRGIADTFGYNVGYMLEILATPPDGVEANPRFDVTCDGLFSCAYASPKLAVLSELAEFQAAINAEGSEVGDLVTELVPVQDGAEPRGRNVWSGGLSVQGFGQEAYDQLLDVSSSFLETVQATGLVNVQAVVDDDPSLAATGIVAEAAQIVWLDAYIAGLTNGEEPIEIPAFG